MLGSFSQWPGDNVDHNFFSIDGKGVLHGMAVVVLSTPATENKARKLQSLLLARIYLTIFFY